MALLSKKDFLHKLNEDYASMNELAHSLIANSASFVKGDLKSFQEHYYHTSESFHKLITDLSEMIKDKDEKISYKTFCDSYMSSVVNTSTYSGMPGNEKESTDPKLALNENQGMTLFIKDKTKLKEFNALERYVIKTYGNDKEVYCTYPGDKIYISQETIETDPKLSTMIEDSGLSTK